MDRACFPPEPSADDVRSFDSLARQREQGPPAGCRVEGGIRMEHDTRAVRLTLAPPASLSLLAAGGGNQQRKDQQPKHSWLSACVNHAWFINELVCPNIPRHPGAGFPAR